MNIAINPGGQVYILPCIAGHVGADAAAVVLAEHRKVDEMTLIVDVGTNAEIVVAGSSVSIIANRPCRGGTNSSGRAPGADERIRMTKTRLNRNLLSVLICGRMKMGLKRRLKKRV